MKATFVLSKDPSHEFGGDLTMSKLVMQLARDSYDVEVICLSREPGSTAGGFQRVPKPVPVARSLLLESVRRRRSLVHTRFVFDELIHAVDQVDTDIFVADHSYMAEAVLQSQRFGEPCNGTSMLAVSTVVPEALVWKATRGVVGRADSRRIVRDEIRVARLAYSVGTYDLGEAEFYRDLGIRRAHWLDLTLPPKEQVPVGASERRLVFLGDRSWGPNQEAFETILRWWPRIADGIRGASLYIVGAAAPNAKPQSLPDGVHDLGFADDLAGVLKTCRGLVAPITTGGGVRVKILDAASRGLPVIGTTAAVGSLGQVLGIECIDDEERFIDRCRLYLLDRAAATADANLLYSANSARWHEARPHAAVQEWLKV